jgi:D-glycero-D-manno-heptose 1,7-bisphosphate phosphatase
MKKLVILDRDGVINYDSKEYIKNVDEWIAIPESIAAIKLLTENDYNIAVATNQSGVGRGLFSDATLQEIHAKMQRVVQENSGEITKIFHCPHAPNASCSCRKPLPGLLLQALAYFKIAEPQYVYYVGDSFKDIEAALHAKCTPILVLTGNGKTTLATNTEFIKSNNIKIYDDLLEFARARLIEK